MKEHQRLFVGYHDLNIMHHQDNYWVTLHLVMETATSKRRTKFAIISNRDKTDHPGSNG